MIIKKENVVWLNDVEMTVLEEDGWAIIYHRDFFNDHEWFDIRRPDGAYIGEDYYNIFDAIDGFNWWKENREVWK